MPKRFQGDESYRLVMPMREPYRLWFSFLKMALDDPELEPLFNKKYYAAWGDIRAVKRFDDWWKDHWKLFAFESGVKVIADASSWKVAHRDDNKIAISVPRDQTLAETRRQIEAILKEERAHKAPRIVQRRSAALYVISATNLKYPSLRLLERIYRLWLKHNRNTEAAALAYFEWAVARNQKLKKHNENVEKQRETRAELKKHAEADRTAGRKPRVQQVRWERAVKKLQVRETGWGSKDDEKYDQRRQVIWRYLRKARRIAKNTMQGKFPGEFTE